MVRGSGALCADEEQESFEAPLKRLKSMADDEGRTVALPWEELTDITKLPREVMENILIRLPPRDLRVSGAVGKTWKLQATSPMLLKEYARKRQAGCVDSLLLAWSRFDIGVPPVAALDTETKRWVSVPFPSDVPRGYFQIVAHAQGLYVCQVHPNRWVIDEAETELQARAEEHARAAAQKENSVAAGSPGPVQIGELDQVWDREVEVQEHLFVYNEVRNRVEVRVQLVVCNPLTGDSIWLPPTQQAEMLGKPLDWASLIIRPRDEGEGYAILIYHHDTGRMEVYDSMQGAWFPFPGLVCENALRTHRLQVNNEPDRCAEHYGSSMEQVAYLTIAKPEGPLNKDHERKFYELAEAWFARPCLRHDEGFVHIFRAAFCQVSNRLIFVVQRADDHRFWIPGLVRNPPDLASQLSALYPVVLSDPDPASFVRTRAWPWAAFGPRVSIDLCGEAVGHHLCAVDGGGERRGPTRVLVYDFVIHRWEEWAPPPVNVAVSPWYNCELSQLGFDFLPV